MLLLAIATWIIHYNRMCIIFCLELKQAMIKQGMTEKEAGKYSRVRFFANESGVYGTNLPDATLASDTWENDESMVKTYLSRMGHLFGTEAGTRNVKLKNFDLFAENLKGTKAACYPEVLIYTVF